MTTLSMLNNIEFSCGIPLTPGYGLANTDNYSLRESQFLYTDGRVGVEISISANEGGHWHEIIKLIGFYRCDKDYALTGCADEHTSDYIPPLNR